MAYLLLRLACLGALIGGVLWPWFAQAATSVTVLLGEPTGIYQDVAQALVRELEQPPEGWRVRVQVLAERKGPGHEDLVIPLGLKALQAVLSESATTPVWSLLVPRQTFEQMAAQPAGRRRPLSALYLDQPLSRHVQMLKAALPSAKRVGVLLGPTSASQEAALRSAASAARLEVLGELIRQPEDLSPALAKFRGQADVLLLLPDPVVLNRGSLQTLLLQTYQLRLPVAAYSIQLIEAGAMLALYASPSQIGAEAGARLRKAQTGGGVRLPAADFPDSFDVAVNRSVAVSLGIQVPLKENLSLRMERPLQ
jgi:ABC-type uncharacterized transport system substrate-binding protein